MALQEEAHSTQREEESRHRQTQIEAELEKKCAALAHSEKMLQAKEKSHRQRIRGLEDQVEGAFTLIKTPSHHRLWP